MADRDFAEKIEELDYIAIFGFDGTLLEIHHYTNTIFVQFQ